MRSVRNGDLPSQQCLLRPASRGPRMVASDMGHVDFGVPKYPLVLRALIAPLDHSAIQCLGPLGQPQGPQAAREGLPISASIGTNSSRL
jgi:hypothetical protein